MLRPIKPGIVLLIPLGFGAIVLANQFAFTTIDFPNSTLTIARGINANGEIVGEYRTADGKTHGFC